MLSGKQTVRIYHRIEDSSGVQVESIWPLEFGRGYPSVPRGRC